MRKLLLLLLCISASAQTVGVSGVQLNGPVINVVGSQPQIIDITLTPATITVGVPTTTNFTALCDYTDNISRDCTNSDPVNGTTAVWSSSNTSVATVGPTANPRVITTITAGTSTIKIVIGLKSGQSTITAVAPLLTPSSIGGGTVGTAYSAQLTCSQGTPPYTFTLVSGGFPSGVGLNTSTGLISGTPATGSDAGSPYTPTITCKDSGNFVSNSVTYSIAISPAVSGSCGPPAYNCSTKSTLSSSTGWNANVLAPFQGPVGVNTTAYDTSIPSASGGANPNCITMASDANSLGGSGLTPSQSGETNDDMWSKNSDFFFLINNGEEYLFHGNPTGNCYVVDTPVPTLANSFRHALHSRVTNGLIYYISATGALHPAGTKLYKATASYSGGVITVGAPTLLYDLATCPGSPITNATLYGEDGIDFQDKFILISWGTNQNTNWKDVMAYNTVSNNCSHLDTVGNGTNGIIWTSDGVSHVTSVASFNIHNAGMSHDGNTAMMSGYGQAAGNTCGSSCPYAYWTPDTTTYFGEATNNPSAGGHPAKGFSWYGSMTNPNYYIRSFTDPNCITPSNCKKLYQLPNGTNIIAHSAWPSPTNDQSYPIIVTSALNTGSTTSLPTNFVGPFNDSLWAIAQDGTTRWFLHFYESYNRTENFEGFNTIFSISQDAKWVAYASDMYYGLGTNKGLGATPTSTPPVVQTFIVKLN